MLSSLFPIRAETFLEGALWCTERPIRCKKFLKMPED